MKRTLQRFPQFKEKSTNTYVSKNFELRFINDDASNFIKSYTCPQASNVIVSLDPTCSGSGLRNHAKMEQDGAAKYVKFQKKLLKEVYQKLTPQDNCFLLYSTCSVFESENEGVISGYNLARPVIKHEPIKDKCRGHFCAVITPHSTTKNLLNSS